MQTIFFRATGDSCNVEQTFLLQSDLHIDGLNTCHKTLEREWKLAKDNGFPILINGDLLDLILPKDMKRFSMSASGPQYHVDDMINKVIDNAVDMLGPYAHLLRMMSMGNHEHAAVRHHSVNTIKLIIDRLRDKCKSPVEYGGYSGYFIARWSGDNDRHYSTWRLFYHHGAGGSAPITKGIIDLVRITGWTPDANAVWIGHKHNQLWVPIAMQRCSNAGVIYETKIDAIMTGGYIDRNLTNGTDSTPYSEVFNMPPQPKGGAFVTVKGNSDRRPEVRAVQFGV